MPEHNANQNVDQFNWDRFSDEDRRFLYDALERKGFVAPRKDGVFTELKQGAAYGGLGVLKGLGSTLEEATGYSGMKEYFGDVMRQNQQYNPSPDYKALSLDPANIARTIGSGAAQSTLALGGAVVGGVLGGGVGGVAASTAMMFGQIYGDRVQEYRDAFPNQDEGTVKGLAIFSSLGESLIESLIGPERLATGIAKKWATGALKETTKGFVKTVGKEAVKNFFTEGLEEVVQDYWDRICRSALDERGIQLPSWEEVGETFMGGAWSGLALGAAGGAVEYRAGKKGATESAPTTETKKTGISPEARKILPPTGTDIPAETTIVNPVTSEPVVTTPAPAAEKVEEDTRNLSPEDRLAVEVGDALGRPVRFFDEPGAPSQTIGKDKNGEDVIADAWYDTDTDELWLNRKSDENSVMFLLGHEFKHELDTKYSDLVKRFNELAKAGLNKEGTEAVDAAEQDYKDKNIGEGLGFGEITADEFGRMWQDPKFWEDVATRAEQMEAGMGQRFLQILQDFIKSVRKTLNKIGTPEAKQLFDNLSELREEAVRITAEIKRQNGETETATAPAEEQAAPVRAEVPETTASVRADEVKKPVQEEEPVRATDKQTGNDLRENMPKDYGKITPVPVSTPSVQEIKKAPKDVQWSGKPYHGGNETVWNKAEAGVLGDDAYIRMQAKGQVMRVFEIKDFRNKTINEIRMELNKSNLDTAKEHYPLGRVFDDALDSLHNSGMRLDPSMLRPMTSAATEQTPSNNFLDEHIVVSGAPITGTQVAEAMTEQGAQVEQVGQVEQGAQADTSDEAISKELRNVINMDGATGQVKAARLSRLAKDWGMSLKEVQERTEAEVVKMAREINAEKISKEEKYNKLVELYNRQPTFSVRTSTSMMNQAYSTPVPLAWLLGERIGIDGKTVYEPTAGTGMLTVAGTPSSIDVNEIDVLRSSILKGQGFRRVTSNDASKGKPNRNYDRVIMNPPFGTGAQAEFDGYNLTKLDHVIAARALEAMKPDGSAAIIIGANTTNRKVDGRPTVADHVFMNYLYSHYNVKDNYIMSGDLYRKQGATYPIRILTIDGKKSEITESTHPQKVEILDSWDTLYDKLKGELPHEQLSEPGRSDRGDTGLGDGQNTSTAAEEGRTDTGNEQRDTERTGSDVGENRPASAGERTERAGGADEQRTGSERSDGTREDSGPVVSESAESVDGGYGLAGSGTETVSGERAELENGVETGTAGNVDDTGRSESEGTGRTGVGNDRNDVRAPVRPGRIEVGEKRGELNNTYVSASKGNKMDVVVPNFLAPETERALQNLQNEVGDVDEYVRKELGYESKDELYECLSDAQVDSVAAAIHALKNGDGFIIGDQTGIGKGRQCAAIMRWAKKNGQVPIFFTKDPKLFSDAYVNDLPDIHTQMNPILVGDPQKANAVDADNNVVRRVPRNLQEAFESLGKGDSEYDSVFITYSQVSKANNRQQQLIRDLIGKRKCVIILDEAHEAAGSTSGRDMSNTANFFFGTTKADQGKNENGILFSDVGVVYSSATFAKRPDTMGLYAVRTRVKDAVGGSVDSLTKVLKRGGTALQQVISKAVTEAGEYIRRERDFDGVTFDIAVDETNREDVEERFDRVAYVLGELVKHSKLIAATVNEAEGGNYGTANTREDTSIETSNFASVTHNYISQLLLASKTGIIVDNAERAFKKGQKPVITVDNTLESALKEYCEDNGIMAGAELPMKYSDILENALNRMYSFTRRSGKGGKAETITFSPEQYGLASEHALMLKKIHELDDIDLPISPIDYIKNELENRGIKVSELTGRTYGIDYSAQVPTLTIREAKSKDKNKNVNDFNSGRTDAMILNRSGSTGLSLHSSQKFKDQKQRHMIMGQPNLDIAVVQQTFGRVLRSGQVNKPVYTILSSFLAPEKRVMMVLSRKMQSLNANTTANNKSAVSLGVDFLNKYGDEVAAEFLTENPEIADQLGLSVSDKNDTSEDLMKKMTGKMAILPNEQQERIYDDLTARYQNKVDFLKKTGNYDLEISVHDDWDVITDNETEMVPGNKNGTIFDQPVTLKQIQIKEKSKIRDAKEVREEINKNLGSTDEEVKQKLDESLRTAAEDIENLENTYDASEKSPEEIRDRKTVLRSDLNIFKSFIRNNADSLLEIQIGDDEYTGIITGFRRIGKYSPRSPFVPSNIVVDFAIADTVGRLSIPYSKLKGGTIKYQRSLLDLEEAFTGEDKTIRTPRFAFTGNLMRGLDLAERGKVVAYRTHEGNVENALLMPKKWQPQEIKHDPRNEIKSVDEVFSTIQNLPWSRNGYSLASPDGAVISKQYGYTGNPIYEIRVPRTSRKGEASKFAKDKQLVKITGDFMSRGKDMVSPDLSENDAKKAVKYMMGNGTVFMKPQGRSYKLKSSEDAVTENDSPETISAEANNRHYKLVTDKKLIQKLDNEDYITTYRAAQLVDGKLYPPMAAKVNGEWAPEIQLGKWEQADEHPEQVVIKNGKAYFPLNKGNGKTIMARYNPYLHSSTTPLNDQFSSAYDRGNLVTLEIRVPKSELTSGYHAEKAKDSVGMMEWKAGPVQAKLSGTREVMLSRWDKAVRIVPDSEVAKIIKGMVRGKVNSLPANVLTPSLRAELEKIGVPISDGKKFKTANVQQVNPIREEGEVKDQYQELLDNSTYTVRGEEVVNKDAARMIAGFGGINGTIKAIQDGDFKPSSDTAQRALQIVLLSDEFKKMSDEEQSRISDVYIKSGTAAGQTLASRRLGAFDWNNLDSIQAHINALMAKLGKDQARKVRDKLFQDLGIDLDALPDDIVNNPRELDKVIRSILAERATKFDKFYEYWINSILSSPTTHVANTIGNITNAAYELGVKRLTEATINSFARALGKGTKNAATFGEFKEMMKAFDWHEAWRRARLSWDIETMNTQSKLEKMRAAIGGKKGQIIRTPGRLLKAADEFAKALIVPMEAAAFAYRQGVEKGYSGEVLSNFIQEQLKDEKSDANAWGKERSLDLTFQEQLKPGSAVNYLIQLREAGGVSGNMLKFVLPFAKTPYNILRQGIRKSPLGAANLAWQTVQGLRGKRQFDNEYVSLLAEQLLAWGVVMMLAAGGDDDKPFITGSSPRYGSAEQRFKENKLPPYSIRIGKNYYSYQRIEPLATGLAFIADGLEAYKRARRGEDGQKIMRDLLGKTGRMVREKSFLDSINTIGKAIEDPETSGMKWVNNFLASWSPNVVRHTINMFDDNVRDNRARDRGMNWFEDQFYVTMNAAGYVKASPRYDYFGRTVKKDSLADSGPIWPLARVVPIKSIAPDENMNRAEKLMWKYNMTHPGEEYYPDVPAYYFQRDGQKLYTTGKYWDEFAQKSGQLALKQINNAFKHGLLNERNPTAKDIDLIKKIFTRARKEVRDEMYQRKHYQR